MRRRDLQRKLFRENQIYIIPTLRGFLFLAADAAMILTAATYNNNLIFILGFFMFALFVVVMLQTHYNVKGVRVRFRNAEEGFAGDPIGIHFELTQKRAKWKRGLEVRSASRRFPALARVRLDLHPSDAARSGRIEVTSKERGIFPVPDLILETFYPLGLFRAWKVLRSEGVLVVYPRPQGASTLAPASSDSGQEELGLRTSPEGDFGELRNYLPGESYHQIAWKHYARTGDLYSKVHWGEEHRHYIIPSVRPGGDVERQLSQRSRWIQLALEENATFELQDDRGPIEPGQGFDQARRCWRRLAEFGRSA